MSNESLSEGELTKKYPKLTKLLKTLGINILKDHPNSLANNITILKLENCYKYNEEILLNPPKVFIMLICDYILHYNCLEKSNIDKQKTCLICFIDNEGTASTEVQNIDMSKTVEDEGEKTSNLMGTISKLSIDGGKTISRSEIKSMEPNKVQGLIKELSMPSELIDDNNRGNKNKESKPITLFQLYNNASQAKNVYNNQQARGLVYDEVSTNLLGFTRDSLHKKTAKTRNIYKLFEESYNPDTKKIVKRIGIEKIKRIRTY
ncbi:23470_t:CDS:2, partial [Cetraspora pellucida]